METKPVPQILKVKDLKEDDRFSDIHDNLPKMPCLGLLIDRDWETDHLLLNLSL